MDTVPFGYCFVHVFCFHLFFAGKVWQKWPLDLTLLLRCLPLLLAA